MNRIQRWSRHWKQMNRLIICYHVFNSASLFQRDDFCGSTKTVCTQQKLAENQKNRSYFFGSKAAKMKILLCKVDMGNKLYKVNFFSYVVKKWSLWSKFTSSKKVSWFFSKGLRFRILLRLDFETTYPQAPQVYKSTFRYSGGFSFN